ncbi:DUF7220 family protein [Jannaschia seohaensis]|uniref:Uncharacterized protein n=1 Tax=Jannaschia seohaensis TaxID=475081 RepID=A0A2Y9C3K7_9RHOB|nr:hypothetical protein [Jannaschia seohaensis]PWJ10505.1 hypothetical protein BCF38_12315 [Jannaschia seohaensis]SSA51652.1 hypothetical protein SAMN05421539_12315 [Jannaschia seohaensis]
MSQSRALSFLEAAVNVLVGYAIALATQFAVFTLVGIDARARQMLAVGLVFTVVSLVRSYVLRRIFGRIGRTR